MKMYTILGKTLEDDLHAPPPQLLIAANYVAALLFLEALSGVKICTKTVSAQGRCRTGLEGECRSTGKGQGQALVIAPQADTATTEALMARTKQRRTYLPSRTRHYNSLC